MQFLSMLNKQKTGKFQTARFITHKLQKIKIKDIF